MLNSKTPNGSWLPHRDYHPDLTLDRLTEFGSLLKAVWHRCSELHQPDEGDDMWSMSCRAFVRSAFQLKRKSQGDWHWLTVTEAKKMQLVVTVGVIPARFYHGDSLDDMPLRYSQPPDAEKAARQGVLDFEYGIKGLLRFVTKTNAHGVPMSVHLVEFDEESDAIINRFEIPDAAAAAPAGVVEFRVQPKPGVTQPKPQPRPLSGSVKRQGDDVE